MIKIRFEVVKAFLYLQEILQVKVVKNTHCCGGVLLDNTVLHTSVVNITCLHSPRRSLKHTFKATYMYLTL